MTYRIIKRREFLKEGAAIGLFGLIFSGLSGNHISGIKNTDKSIIKNIHNLRNGRKMVHRIIVLGDPHWFDHHVSPEHPRLGKWANNIHYKKRHEMMISWLNEDTDSTETDFIVFNGDLVTNRPEHLTVVKGHYDRLNANYYVVHGNHDHSSEENWKDLWGYGRNHSFTLGNYGIVLLNSASESGRYECGNHEWLESQLNYFNDKFGIFVFCHIFQHGSKVPWGIDCPSVTDVMMAADNLKMVVYSHTHTFDSFYPVVKGGQELTHTPLNAFFTGHFSAWGLPYLGYRVIEIYDDNKIGTYVYSPENETVINYNLMY